MSTEINILSQYQDLVKVSKLDTSEPKYGIHAIKAINELKRSYKGGSIFGFNNTRQVNISGGDLSDHTCVIDSVDSDN